MPGTVRKGLPAPGVVPTSDGSVRCWPRRAVVTNARWPPVPESYVQLALFVLSQLIDGLAEPIGDLTSFRNRQLCQVRLLLSPVGFLLGAQLAGVGLNCENQSRHGY
jgi:hypothetical protein